MSQLADQFDFMDLDDFEDLLADRPNDERWELIDRRVVRVAMGTRWEHNVLCQNIAFELRRRLRERHPPFFVFRETFFMKSKAIESATLPDVMVARGPIVAGATSVGDPVVLVEVTSRGSAARDRHEKWRAYRRLPSLLHYVLVDRDCAAVDVFDLHENGRANLRQIEGLDCALELPFLGLSLPLRDIYEDVLSA
jgi:Uma2 family endonuclease